MEKVLLILESEDLQKRLKETLSNYQVEICSAQEAENMLTLLQPDALVLDLLDDETIVESLLMRFQMHGKPRVLTILRTAVLMAFRDPDYMLTKDIYPVLTKEYGGNADAVDQAIRRMLRSSWNHRAENSDVWEMILRNCDRCPTNGEFITAAALYLRKKYPSRFRKGS